MNGTDQKFRWDDYDEERRRMMRTGVKMKMRMRMRMRSKRFGKNRSLTLRRSQSRGPNTNLL